MLWFYFIFLVSLLITKSNSTQGYKIYKICMKLIKLKPITSGMRHQLNIKKNLLSKTNKILKNSILGVKKFAGRSSLNGKISVWHKGGGCKSNFRKINFSNNAS